MSIGTRVKALLFPPKCASCQTLSDWYHIGPMTGVLCEKCYGEWDSAVRQTCRICSETVCSCTCMPEMLQRVHAAAFYKSVYYDRGKIEPVQNRVIYRIKRTRNARLDDWLANVMLKSLSQILSACGDGEVLLTYIPRGRHAKINHGTDQAEALAVALSRASGVQMQELIVRRDRYERVQKKLSAADRLRAAKASYRCIPNVEELVRGRNIVLIDDIVTTGASMAACIQLLRAAGARKVFCLALAASDVMQSEGVLAKSRK